VNETILIILSVTALLYLLQTIFIYSGTRRLNYSKTQKLPNISILVALRNEEKTIKPCVESLLRLDYPKTALEILLINDRSRDRTPEIIEELKKGSPLIKTLHIQKGIEGLSGKANAIAQGMEHGTGDLILVTDGDCRVPPAWAKAHAAYYTENVGLVGGFTLLDEKYDRTQLFGKIQSLDWAYLLSIGTGAMGFGLPLSILGNNFSFCRKAYDEIGGYRTMGFTIIEDFALMKTLLKKTSWEVLYPIDPNMVVYSHPMPDLKRFYHQRKRWSAGGKEVGLYGKFLMFLSHFIHILLPVSFIFSHTPTVPLLGLLGISLADFCLLFRTTGLVGRRDLLKYFPLWEIFYFAYTIFFAPILLFPTTVTWKDISYSWRLNWKMKKMVEHR
jgi:cellulose synthase/poly-beta-1,6-N-acetylglucosamine synthase-like glycosyltransferase